MALSVPRTAGNDDALPILVPEGFRIVAHRGASAHAPENTLAAFRLAARMGVREVELDVRFSKDKHLVICHDPTLDRFGHPGCAVADMTLRELKSLDVGTWFAPAFRAERLLTLGELFDEFGSRFVFHVEIKGRAPGVERAVANALESHGLVESAFVRSFDHETLDATRSLNPKIRTGWLVREGGLSRDHLDRAVAIGCHQLCPPAGSLRLEDVRAAHAALPEIQPYQIRDVSDVRRVVDTGCDGVTLDNPEWLAHRTLS